MSCNTGHLDYISNNVAATFMKTNNISKTYAWDGSIKYPKNSTSLFDIFDVKCHPVLANHQHYFDDECQNGKRNPRGQVIYERHGKNIDVYNNQSLVATF